MFLRGSWGAAVESAAGAADAGVGPPRKKRLFSADFPPLEQDAPQESGWRNAAHADWHLKCGDEVFPVHKAIVCRGPRASGLLVAACSGRFAERPDTDLSEVLPEACRPLLPDVLDFIYEGKFLASAPRGLLPLFVAADIMQIKALFERALDALNSGFDWKVAPQFLVESAGLLGTHPLVDQVAEAAEREVFQHFGRLLTDWGVRALVSMLGHFLSAEQLQALLDRDTVAAQEDQVFHFLKEWTATIATDQDCALDHSKSPWAVCRFAQLSPECLLEAGKLEASRDLPAGIVSLSLALRRVLDCRGEAACEQHCKALPSSIPEGWLQSRRLKVRVAGLRRPVAGEVRLFIHRSSQSGDTPLETSAASAATVQSLKHRLCVELGLDASRVRIWDYYGLRPYALLEKYPENSLQSRRILDQSPIMLEEQFDNGGWSLQEED